ncbi:MAG: sigma-70 family RNA polymerase sigma factor [Saprospiraceae bacterium]|nr:sigma-70 family RNA polymerase sigma factor [Saprospiraceae bacterium]
MQEKELSDIFKEEYSNLVAVLCHHYGIRDVQLAEDIVSETFVSAMKSWSHGGVPDAPKAWLRRVARNKLTDHYRRKQHFDGKIAPHFQREDQTQTAHEITDEIINDSQLRMIFVVCDPALNQEAQICLALRILCGFNIEEIAKALLSKKDTINKKLYRAKQTIKSWERLDTQLSAEAYKERLDKVLRVIYLLFSEGYYSSVREESISHDICWNAMRLAVFLSRQDMFSKEKIYALIALMCFHASRLEARAAGRHGDLLYEEQDRQLWDKALLDQGEAYLNRAANGTQVSKYHLEAAIAYWHTVEGEQKWENILQLYNKLLTLEYSPIIALNRTYALAKANSVEEALVQALKLSLDDHHLYHCLVAELYRLDGDKIKEKQCLERALHLAPKRVEQEVIRQKLARIKTVD